MTLFSRAAGAGEFVGVNMWPWITPYPPELWPALADGRLTEAMMPSRPAAFGPALTIYGAGGRDLLCLGRAPDGWPLHPLAREKQAIPNPASRAGGIAPRHNERVAAAQRSSVVNEQLMNRKGHGVPN